MCFYVTFFFDTLESPNVSLSIFLLLFGWYHISALHFVYQTLFIQSVESMNKMVMMIHIYQQLEQFVCLMYIRTTHCECIDDT